MGVVGFQEGMEEPCHWWKYGVTTDLKKDWTELLLLKK